MLSVCLPCPCLPPTTALGHVAVQKTSSSNTTLKTRGVKTGSAGQEMLHAEDQIQAPMPQPPKSQIKLRSSSRTFSHFIRLIHIVLESEQPIG